MALKQRAFTLMETIVYLGLFALVGALLASMYSYSRQTQQATAAAYAVTGQADTTIQWLRRDLEDTALASVQVYPGSDSDVIKPAVSFVSPRAAADTSGTTQGKLWISEYGVPRWSKYVYYQLRRSPGALVGDLIRWEQPLAAADQDRLPRLAPFPNGASAILKPRVLLHNVLGPQKTIDRLGGLPNGWVGGVWGGFRVQFVRRSGGEHGAESMSNVNPSVSQGSTADNTRLLEVELDIADTGMGAPNFYAIKFRVCPQY